MRHHFPNIDRSTLKKSSSPRKALDKPEPLTPQLKHNDSNSSTVTYDDADQKPRAKELSIDDDTHSLIVDYCDDLFLSEIDDEYSDEDFEDQKLPAMEVNSSMSTMDFDQSTQSMLMSPARSLRLSVEALNLHNLHNQESERDTQVPEPALEVNLNQDEQASNHSGDVSSNELSIDTMDDSPRGANRIQRGANRIQREAIRIQLQIQIPEIILEEGDVFAQNNRMDVPLAPRARDIRGTRRFTGIENSSNTVNRRRLRVNTSANSLNSPTQQRPHAPRSDQQQRSRFFSRNLPCFETRDTENKYRHK